MRVYSQEGSPSKDSGSEDEIARFSVLYAKSSTRKHKKWEGDGFLFCYPHLAVLKTDDLKSVVSKSTSIKKVDDLVDGFILKMGSLEVLIQERLSPMDSIYKPNVVSPGEKTATPFVLAANGLNVKKELKRKMDSSELDTPDFKKSFVCPVPGYSSTTSSNIVVQPTKLADPPREIAGFFASNLRPHQVEGVIFIVKKLNSAGGGAILADEMGLGKTVQTLAAMYSLMGNKLSSTSDVRKVLLVVPSSLVNNWKAEFRKWFGAHRFPAVDVKKAEDVRKFSVGCKYTPFLLISYDMALRTIKILNSLQFDAIVCDEGHRLKNTNSKLRKALYDLNIGRRLLLTGTPVQNDIDEFYSLLDFVRPGTFGTVAEFRKSQNDEESIDIHRLIKSTLLRRTSEINTSHLPPKNEYVVFCSKSPVQNQVYDKLCGHMTADHLLIIGYLRKLANHPALLFKSLSEKPSAASDYILSAFPNDYGQRPPALNESGKLHVLSEMLTNFRLLDECTVIVSNYVKTLDMIESLCQSIGMRVMRLDGGVAVQERQKIVDKFNKEKNPNNIFLLSTKAGGVGLNLIGASRLILFDSEWNPACDLQAMGRIWRDGQIRPCHIYRLCTAGSIDEKIFQRQVKKTSLSSFLGSSFDTTSSNVKFSDEELRDIYQNVHSASNTHDMLDCSCGGNGLLPTEMDDESLEVPSVDEEISSITVDNIPENNENSVKEEINEDVQEQTGPASMAELFRWRHFSPDCPTSWQLFLANSGLKNSPHITFAFQLTSQF